MAVNNSIAWLYSTNSKTRDMRDLGNSFDNFPLGILGGNLSPCTFGSEVLGILK